LDLLLVEVDLHDETVPTEIIVGKDLYQDIEGDQISRIVVAQELFQRHLDESLEVLFAFVV